MNTAGTERWLRVRMRRSWTAAGRGPTELTVSCQERAQTIDLVECMSCAKCAAVSLDDSGTASYTHCGSLAALEVDDDDPLRQLTLTRVSEIMTPSVMCLEPDVSLSTATELIQEHGI